MIKPETKTEIKLADWFYQNNILVWHNRKIKELQNTNIFKTVSKTNKKPDMVIYSNLIKKYIALEIKDATKSKSVLEAGKIINYQNDYKNKKTFYYIDRNEIQIDSFLIATNFSRYGKLFDEDEIVFPSDEKFRKLNRIRKLEPSKEYIKSKQFLRNLWATWKTNGRTKEDLGIGILLSSALEDDELQQPMIFDLEHNGIKWRKRWQRI